MTEVRQVDGVSILNWQPDSLPTMLVELRNLVDSGSAAHVLLNLEGVDGLAADSLETLTEATTVCRERGCAIGMYGVTEELRRLVSLMSLEAHLPPVMGDDEKSALREIHGKAEALPEAPTLDFDLPDAATAPTARFAAVTERHEPGSAVQTTPETQPSADLLMINWSDLVQTGFELSGDNAAEIMEASRGGETTPARGLSPQFDLLDLGVDAASDAASDAATAIMPAVSAETLELDLESAKVLGQVDDGEYSPVDTGEGTPPSSQEPAKVASREETVATEKLSAQFVGVEDETVMFQPSPSDLALIADVAAGGSQATAQQPASARQADQAMAFDSGDDEQAVMFQPGAFDAALLAEVAAAAGPETPTSPPVVEIPPPPRRADKAKGPNGELRGFIKDFAISTHVHLEVLDAFIQAGEATLGPADLQLTLGSQQRLQPLLDQLVQCSLVRRTRSSRIRGGTGFVFSPSPSIRSAVVQLVRLWQAPQTRALVTSWLEE